MKNFDAEWNRIKRAQAKLSYAWGFGGAGWVLAFIGTLVRSHSYMYFAFPFLVVCGVGCVGALIWSVVEMYSPIESKP